MSSAEKKIRKKKEVENEDYDILQLDNKIKKIIIDETKKVNQHKNRLNEINETLKTKNLLYRKKKELEKEKFTLEKKIIDLETNNMFAEYICVSSQIINEYTNLLSIPVNVSFFSKKGKKEDNNENNKKEDLLDKFLLIAKKYIPIKTYKKEVKKKLTCECGNNSVFTHTENIVTCDMCGIEKNIYTIQTNFKDIDRVNLSQKYKYNKKVHFRDTVNQYQGKQNKRIDQKIYIDCDEWFLKHNLLFINNSSYHEQHTKITKEHINMALSETGHANHYEDVNLLHNYFTGVACPNISHIENELFEDFDKVVEAYESLESCSRINFLNNQYILYQLLRHRNIRVKESDFEIIKTKSRRAEHDHYWSLICAKLEWRNFCTM